ERIRTLLDLSQIAVGVMYIGLLLLLIGGIAAGLVGGHFSRGWIWASLVLLVLTMVAMYAMATPFYGRFRAAVGTGPAVNATTPLEPASDAEVEALASSGRPMALFAIGAIGFVLILW